MTRGHALVAVLAVAVAGLGVGLFVAVTGGTAQPPSTPPAAPPAMVRTIEPAPTATPSPGPQPAPVPPGGFKKFVAPEGMKAKTYGTDPALRYQIPTGGFAAWTGREGTWPGEVEDFAEQAKLRLPVALEQRRATLLEERTADKELLGELLGAPPSAEVLSGIQKHLRDMHDVTANIQVRAREGSLTEGDAIAQTRAAEDAFRRGYIEATGLTEQQFERFFSPDHPFPAPQQD